MRSVASWSTFARSRSPIGYSFSVSSAILGSRMPDVRGASAEMERGASMKVVFLHGIGDGDPKYEWLDGLNRGLTQAGHEPIDRDQVIAPRYTSYLRTEGRA